MFFMEGQFFLVLFYIAFLYAHFMVFGLENIWFLLFYRFYVIMF